jgi:hypothetical protein
MTKVTTYEDEKGLESISVEWSQEDNFEFDGEARMPNGDPPSLTLWGDDD